MAPDISKVDTDRHLNLRLSAWNFRNSTDLLIPFIVIFSSMGPPRSAP